MKVITELHLTLFTQNMDSKVNAQFFILLF